jgi:predicted  nucleic acid-binding Zn-ribbon protein
MSKGKNKDPLARPKNKQLNPNISDENPVEFANSLAGDVAPENKLDGANQKIDEKEELQVTQENENTKQVETVDNKAQEATKKIMELVAEGKTMEEAIAEVMKVMTPTVAGRTILDESGLIARMEAETNIEELRKKIKIAFAKKSKSKDKPAEAKYDAEIRAGQKRLNELLRECEAVEDPIQRIYKYMEMGEAKGTVLQLILKMLETEADEILKGLRDKMGTKVKDQKSQINVSPDSLAIKVRDTLDGFGPDFLNIFQERHKRGDVRCQALNREYNYIAAMQTIISEPKKEGSEGVA